MSTAPAYWNQVLDSQRCVDVDDFLNGIKYHEDALMSTYSTGDTSLEKRIRQLEVSMKPSQNFRYRPRQNRGNNNIGPGRDFPSNAHANLVGYHPSLEKPHWPRDDSVVSKGKTPEDAGARPCRHCSSPKHWDYDCPHARKGAKQVKVNFANPDDSYLEAQEAYDALYCDDSEEELQEDENNALAYEDPNENQSGFHKPLQGTTFSTLHVSPDMSLQGELSRLEGSTDSSKSALGSGTDNSLATTNSRTHCEQRAFWKQSMQA